MFTSRMTNKLKAAPMLQGDQPNDAKSAIERAEAAVEALSPAFQTWLTEEVAALVDAYNIAADDEFSIESRQGIFLSAHTLKGQASTLGYPQIAQLAASLCRLLDYWNNNPNFQALAAEHVRAIGRMADHDPQASTEDNDTVLYLTGKTEELVGDPLAWD